MDIGAALNVLGTDRLSYLAVGELDDNQQTLFQEQFGDRLALSRNTEAFDLSQLTQSLHTNLTALGLLSFIVGVFIVFNAVNFSLSARTKVFRVLDELGVPAPEVGLAILIETLIWSLTGALLGTLLAQPVSTALMPAVASTMQNIYGAHVSSVPLFNGELFLKALALASAGLAMTLMLPLMLIALEPTARATPGPIQVGRSNSRALAAGGRRRGVAAARASRGSAAVRWGGRRGGPVHDVRVGGAGVRRVVSYGAGSVAWKQRGGGAAAAAEGAERHAGAHHRRDEAEYPVRLRRRTPLQV